MIKKKTLVPLTIVLLAAVLLVPVSRTLTTVWVFIPGLVVTYIVYLNTYHKKTPDPQKLLPWYLLLLGIQFIHFTEEYLTGFVTEVPRLWDQPPYPLDNWVVFNMIAYSLFVLGGIIIFKQVKELMVIPIFFILVGVLFNSIAHILIAIYVGGYFPGLYTALIYMVLGPLFLRKVRMDPSSP